MKTRFLPPLLLVTAAFGCSATDATVLESTTTEVPAQGGIATSADGLFSVRIPDEALAAQVSIDIETMPGPAPAQALSRVYEVRISELALRTGARLMVSYDVRSLRDPETVALARIPTGGDPVALQSEPGSGRLPTVESSLSAFLAERFCVVAAPLPPVPTVIEGWDDPPGVGRTFIVNSLSIADQNVGFDLDGQCGANGCIDNYLWRLGEFGNDQIRQALLGGETLMLIELAGLNEPYSGDDNSVTAKIYAARDADDPYFPANNFEVPAGHTECCSFMINPQSLAGIPAQARTRTPSQIERGRLSSLAPTPIQFTLGFGAPPHPEVRLERVLLSARLDTSLDGLREGLLGAVVPINTLAQTENPYCQTLSPRCPVQFTDSTLIDLVSTLFGPQPDIDVDGDGPECVIDTDGDGSIDLCCDGAPGQSCGGIISCPSGAVVSPIDPNRPSSCALSPRMADGYSIGFNFTAVPARLVGVGP